MESVVTDLNGVDSADADRFTNSALVNYDSSKVTPEQMAEAINSQTFYQASVTSEFIKTARFKIPGLDTPEDATELDQVLRGVEGIEGGTLSIDGLSLGYDVREISPERLVEIINSGTSFTASIDTSAPASAPQAESTATAIISVEGMTDDQTASQVTGTLLLEGIVDGSVNTEDASLTVVYDTAKLTAQKIVDAIREAVPNNVSLVSVTEPGSGGSVLSSAWFVLTLVGLAVAAVFAFPVLRRRLQPQLPTSKAAPGSGRRRAQRRRRK